MTTKIVSSSCGELLVKDNGHVLRATGITYATASRFAPPSPASPATSLINATERGPACPQLPSRFDWVTGPIVDGLVQDEDCLTLTVTAPSHAKDSRPVMVFFHGGAYMSGSGESDAYNPSILVQEQDIVVVTVNYRLGILGNLAIDNVAPANLSLMDQICALEWVRSNIASFGGDPQNVTIFGQSAGGFSVYCLLLAEGTDHLFQRAILQSAPLALATGRDGMVRDMGEAALSELGPQLLTASINDVLSCGATITARALPHGAVSGMAYAPQLGVDPLPPEDKILERLQRRVDQGVNILIGTNSHEGSPYSLMAQGNTTGPFNAVENFVMDEIATGITAMFTTSATEFEKLYQSLGGTVQRYLFEWHPQKTVLGSCHALDVTALLGSRGPWNNSLMMASSYDEVEVFAPRMRKMWASFARNGVSPDAHSPIRIPADL